MTTTTRRTALALTGSGVLAALAGCNPATSSADPLPARGSAAAAPTTRDWIAFARTVQGPVDLPGTAPYARTKRVFDTRFDANRPAAVMVVQRSSDIARAMRFAQRFGLQVAPRAGGHSYVGASAANGTLVLDLRPLHSVSYDARSRSVLVASGATLYDVKKHLAAVGRGIPTGTCPTVGAAGLALGGGLGVESRAHGLTADRLTEARLVLPDGRSITASAAQHSDIFWALRGGGGGNIGVVTVLRFATHPAGEQGIFTLTFAGGAAVRVLTGWARWIRTTARSRWAGVHVDATGHGRLHVSVVGVTAGGDERAAAASLVHTIGTSPTATSYRRLGYLDAAVYLGGGTTSPRQRFTAGSDVLATVDAAAAAAVVRAVTARSRAGLPGSALLDPLTGAVTDLAPGATAFPWRRHTASVQWYVGDSSYASARDWLAAAHRSVGPYSAGGYVNYLETGQPARRYYDTNLDRLATVRRTYDPQRRVHSGLAV
ncbi:FAD-binding protein [Flexivirga sp.]|uniref:FAD-dependent oxidoreductase n=1 Tax=Flexivirga sp. TaxID=1962927 RepID=UPI003F7F068C